MTPENTRLMTDALVEAGVRPEEAANAIKATEKAKEEIAQLKAQLAEQRALIEKARLANLCTDSFVGTSQSSTHNPGSLLDIIVGTSPHQLIANLTSRLGTLTKDAFPSGPIALVPVQLWPCFQQDPKKPHQNITTKDGKPIANLSMGRTFINRSLATAPFKLPTGTTGEVSLSGMASISVAMNLTTGSIMDPTVVHDQIERSISRTNFQATSTNPSLLGDSSDTGILTFIPSQASEPDPSQAAQLAYQAEQGRIAARSSLAKKNAARSKKPR